MHIANEEYMGKTKFRSYYDKLPDKKVEPPKNLFLQRILSEYGKWLQCKMFSEKIDTLTSN
ncbi:hypothetical protein HQ45_06755 [Porphyromonas crevioricanis]|nr:hypothetical protein HQ45_06755 [Porphyromonas crevioricanis]